MGTKDAHAFDNPNPTSYIQVLALVAFGKAQKAAVIVVPLVVALPTAQALVAVCTVPTLLGYWKSEYGVSYACALCVFADTFIHR